MGQGGYITIVNMTKSKFVKAKPFDVNQMNSFDFPDQIPALEKKRFYVEWSEGFFENIEKDYGIAEYTIPEHTETKVIIKMGAKVVPTQGYSYNIERNITVTKICFPKSPLKEITDKIEWKHDGDMFIILFDWSIEKIGREWMSLYYGDCKINEITIAGTHDSLAYSFSMFPFPWVGFETRAAQTQNLDILHQLYSGVRFFDIRIDQNLKGCHGIVDCENGLDEAMNCFKQFLSEFKSETIIMRIMDERDIDDYDLFFQNLDRIYTKYQDLFWIKTKDEWPELREVRGKIIILDSMKHGKHFFSSLGCGFIYDQSDLFYIQDEYDKPDEDYKFKKIKECFDFYEYDSKKLVINYISASGTAGGAFPLITWPPKKYADNLNPKVTNYLSTEIKMPFHGIVAFDFVDLQLFLSLFSHQFNP